MSLLVTIVHVLICVFLVIVVLLQAGKGADIGARFGGSSQTVFGSSGATPFLTKLTAVIALLFMATSLTLATFSTKAAKKTLFKEEKQQTEEKQKMVPQQEEKQPEGAPEKQPEVPVQTK